LRREKNKLDVTSMGEVAAIKRTAEQITKTVFKNNPARDFRSI